MFRFSRPAKAEIERFLAAQDRAPFSYPEVGASRNKTAPHGYTVDHNRALLGSGEGAFERAKAAIREWRMFDFPWLELCFPDTPIEPGKTVAVLASHFGFWSLNPSRIVYVVDEAEPLRRYGFAYGTLRGHAELGEERFTVEHQPEDSVWYDILAFSRPSPLVRLANPIARQMQRRFQRDSMNAMQRAVARNRS